jgi:hypothetical protein
MAKNRRQERNKKEQTGTERRRADGNKEEQTGTD